MIVKGKLIFLYAHVCHIYSNVKLFWNIQFCFEDFALLYYQDFSYHVSLYHNLTRQCICLLGYVSWDVYTPYQSSITRVRSGQTRSQQPFVRWQFITFNRTCVLFWRKLVILSSIWKQYLYIKVRRNTHSKRLPLFRGLN